MYSPGVREAFLECDSPLALLGLRSQNQKGTTEKPCWGILANSQLRDRLRCEIEINPVISCNDGR
jgi:hypothetical protein